MFFANRNRDTTPDLCELLAQAQNGLIFEPDPEPDPIYDIRDTEYHFDDE